MFFHSLQLTELMEVWTPGDAEDLKPENFLFATKEKIEKSATLRGCTQTLPSLISLSHSLSIRMSQFLNCSTPRTHLKIIDFGLAYEFKQDVVLPAISWSKMTCTYFLLP